jgi:RHS repeat-associated protein
MFWFRRDGGGVFTTSPVVATSPVFMIDYAGIVERPNSNHGERCDNPQSASFDQNDWLGRIEVKTTGVTTLDLGLARNANGQLTGVTDNTASGRGATFGYTDAGRLSTAKGSWGDQTYTYDAAGNRVGKSTQVGVTTVQENLVMASTSNRVNSTRQGGGTTIRTLTWRAGGDLSRMVLASGPTTYDYLYNARKRLRLVKLNGANRGQYAYDFRGQRVSRTRLGVTPAPQTHYVFDLDGHLLAEHDGATGAVIREYVWLDDMVVAVMESSVGPATTYFVHTGQLDEPLAITDGTKTRVWSAYLEPWGQAQVLNSSPVELGLRLPGQWEQFETGGFFQNWHRDYDPNLGRYIQADPLGVEAGQNLYGYVDGRPTEWIDRDGRLAVLALPLVVVAPEVVASITGFTVGTLAALGVSSLAKKHNDISRTAASAKANIQCPDPDCANVSQRIDALVRELKWRHTQLVVDRHRLPAEGRMSQAGHVAQYTGKQRSLMKEIAKAKVKGCVYRSDADQWVWSPPPRRVDLWSPPNSPIAGR